MLISAPQTDHVDHTAGPVTVDRPPLDGSVRPSHDGRS
uniref:Uncharacterized protein n=1 Tax=Verrucosispora sp. MS100047 TaxID=1410949 RepID=A0A097CT81_9ACTN|nr:hypothetical protein VASRM7_600 [Verrucosispora sp. MS100047]